MYGRLSNFWKGGLMVQMGCGPAHAMFFSVHEFIKSYVVTLDELWKPAFFALGGGVACIFHDLVMTPFDALKQRSQINPQLGNY